MYAIWHNEYILRAVKVYSKRDEADPYGAGVVGAC